MRTFFLLALFCAGITGCQKTEDTAVAPKTTPAPAVSVARAEYSLVQAGLAASGPIAAREEMQLGSEVGGARVLRVLAEVGDTVKAGQALIELDHRLLDSDLGQAQASVVEAQAAEGLARANLRRGQALAQSQMISRSALDELQAAVQAASARSGSARAAQDSIALRRSFATVRAPAGGIVSRRSVEAGQIVTAGTELIRIIRGGALEWRAELGAAELGRVDVGMSIAFPAYPSEKGRVRAVAPGVSSATRTGTVYVELAPDTRLAMGAFVEGRVLTTATRALTVPEAAVVQRDGFATVFVLKDGKALRRRVATEGTRAGRTTITEGLQEGEEVVARGAGFLSDGDAVRVTTGAAR